MEIRKKTKEPFQFGLAGPHCRWANKKTFYLLFDPKHELYYSGNNGKKGDVKSLITRDELFAKPYIRLKNARKEQERINRMFRKMDNLDYHDISFYSFEDMYDRIRFEIIDQDGESVD